ncbi:MAG: YtxH domain-containing protein, partial [Chloroflexota bacterium]|nr:YtxH domain-containing protein [Chloroflexota bacterium]
GALIGAVAALLYAPRSGDVTREELRQRSEELRRRADDLQRVAQKLADDAQVKGRELVGEAKRQWDRTGSGSGGSGPMDTGTGSGTGMGTGGTSTL